MISRTDTISRDRVTVAVAKADLSPNRGLGTVAEFKPPHSPSINGHDRGCSCEHSDHDAKPEVRRPGLADWPPQFSAPYVDMAAHPMYDISAVARTHGIKFYTLAFITADPQNRPAWGGYAEYVAGDSPWDKLMKSQIESVRVAGGDVMVSFGGAAGKELAETITDIATLTAAYRQVIDAYKLTHIDFDIEGAAQRDRASIDRRSRAIAALQREAVAAGHTLQIWFTLPILPTGLTASGLRSVKSAIEHGVKIAGVNGMAMEFGDRNAPDPAGKMGQYAIQSGVSLFLQLKSVCATGKDDAQLWKMVGITPMIGRNGVPSETFGQSDARELAAWADGQRIGRLSMWSLNRDKENPEGKIDRVESKSSSLEQAPFEFSLIFEKIQH
jgi:hypothetical protein